MELPQLTFRQFERTQEVATIRKAWTVVKKERRVQVVLVGGESGTGKTSLVSSSIEEFRPICFLGEAKFESRGTRSSLPFAPLRQLLGGICNGILLLEEKKETNELALLRVLLQKSVPPSEQAILISVNPRIGDVLWDETESPGNWREIGTDIISKDGVHVLRMAVRSFFRTIAKIRPIILCLDDILWGDETTLYVMKSLLTDETQKSLLFCATYRDDESGSDQDTLDKLDEWIRSLQAEQPPDFLHSIQLPDLNFDQIQELLAETMRGKDTDDLAELFHRLTRGNLFFMAQLLENLQATDLLTFDWRSGQWTWDIEGIKRRTSLSDNVVGIVTARLERLPEDVCGVLTLASCFGSRFPITAITACTSMLDISEQCVESSLDYLCQEDLLIHLGSQHYKFSHDTIQLAAYTQLANAKNDDLDKFHWNIGVNLMETTGLEQNDSMLFACVDQLNLGQAGAETHDYRLKVADLNLKAGLKAAAMSAFHPASEYLNAGIETLGEEPFHSTTYGMAIQLHSLYAKTEYCIGHIAESRVFANIVVENAKTTQEKESPYLTLISCYFAEGKVCELVEFCLDRLGDLGEKLPSNPNSLQQEIERQRMKYLLSSKSDEDLLNLPKMANDEKSLAMRILCELVMVLHQQSRDTLLGIVVSTMLRITIKNGITDYTAESFAAAGAYLSSRGKIQQGHRLGSIAEIMLQRWYPDAKELKGRSAVWIASCTKWWVEPIPLSLDLLIAGNKYCMAAGSIAFAFHCNVMYAMNFFYCGLPLAPLQQDLEKLCKLMTEYRQSMTFLMLTPLWQCLLNLLGKSEDPMNMEAGKAYEKWASVSGESKTGLSVLYSYAMQLAFMHGDIDKASEYSEHLKGAVGGLAKAMVFYPVRVFFFALIAIAKVRHRSGKSQVTNLQRRKYKLEAEKHTKTLRGLVASGAINLVHKLQLLEAELLSLSQSTAPERVCKMYDRAIVSASRSGFLQDAAMANYLCFEFCQAQKDKNAAGYLMDSYGLWIDWNAFAIAASLSRRHPGMLESPSTACMNRSSGGFRSRTRFDESLTEKHKRLSL